MLLDEIKADLRDLIGNGIKLRDYITGVYVFLDRYVQIDQSKLIEIIKKYKKRIYIRYSNRLDPKEAEKIIRDILSGYDVNDMVFSDSFGEVYLRIKHLNISQIANDTTDRIILSTGWY
ncbi:MAG: hypothetical protein QXD88_01890, partial [Candidatus Anstonellales archaeon]